MSTHSFYDSDTGKQVFGKGTYSGGAVYGNGTLVWSIKNLIIIEVDMTLLLLRATAPSLPISLAMRIGTNTSYLKG